MSSGVQENVASVDLPNFGDDTAQLPNNKLPNANLVLRMRGFTVGFGPTRSQVQRMRGQSPRKMPRIAVSRLPSTSSRKVQQTRRRGSGTESDSRDSRQDEDSGAEQTRNIRIDPPNLRDGRTPTTGNAEAGENKHFGRQLQMVGQNPADGHLRQRINRQGQNGKK